MLSYTKRFPLAKLLALMILTISNICGLEVNASSRTAENPQSSDSIHKKGIKDPCTECEAMSFDYQDTEIRAFNEYNSSSMETALDSAIMKAKNSLKFELVTEMLMQMHLMKFFDYSDTKEDWTVREQAYLVAEWLADKASVICKEVILMENGKYLGSACVSVPSSYYETADQIILLLQSGRMGEPDQYDADKKMFLEKVHPKFRVSHINGKAYVDVKNEGDIIHQEYDNFQAFLKSRENHDDLGPEFDEYRFRKAYEEKLEEFRNQQKAGK